MNRIDYFNKIETSLEKKLSDSNFNNNIKQIFAWRVGARFARTYDETYIWSKALYLSSNSCKLLQYDRNNNTALKALKQSAEIYEYLSEIAEQYDKDFCYILSALCYDISGYQANALCMVSNLLNKTNELYSINEDEKDLNTDFGDENYILFHIQKILLKQIPFAYLKQKRSNFKEGNCEDLMGITLFEVAVFGLYEHILKGSENTFLIDIQEAYYYYLQKGNVFISHLLQLLSSRFTKYSERSIWKNINPSKHSQSNVWAKYIKLLATDAYEKNKIKILQNRRSTFEFWISQLRAIEQGVVESNESFIIQMPTSAGKTFIAELAILENLTKFPTKKCIYVAPFRALTNEKETELNYNLSKLGYSISSLSGDYEIDEFQNYILNSTDVLIATPEKLDLLFRLQKEYFSKVSLLIIDEGHIIGDISERSALLEFLIIRLKMFLPILKILFISAVMPDSNGVHFSSWLSGKDDNIIKSPIYLDRKVWEPTRKLIGKFSWYTNQDGGEIKYPFINYLENNNHKVPFIPNLIKKQKYGRKFFPKKENKGQTAIALAYKLSEQGATLIFASRPDWAINIGDGFNTFIEILTETNTEILNYFNENLSSNSYYTAKKWLGENHTITNCLKRGVGIHYGDLPDAVRKSIESDFKSGRLRILISTNTIGQGLNFPIKNLIIHSLDINPKKKQSVSIRDFWNIIGRAGRAGKETEGQIVFLNLKLSDEEKFTKYTNIDKIDKVESLFTLLVNLRISNNLTGSDFDQILAQWSEPFLMNILIEEVVETDDQNLIERIINCSLFKIQSTDNGKATLKQGLLNIAGNIRKEIQKKDQLQAFASNGFNLNSNKIIEEYVSNHLEEITQIIANDSYKELLIKILELFNNTEIREIQFDSKIVELNGKASTVSDFILHWIEGKDIEEISNLWSNAVPPELADRSKMFVFFSQALNFKYPWGITAFLIVAAYKLGITIDKLPTNIRSLSSFLKNGLDNTMACFALTLGIRSRELAKFLVDNYDGNMNYENFINWLSNLTLEEIKIWDLDKIEKENIIEVALKCSTKKSIKDINSEFNFTIRGTYFSEEAKFNSVNAKIGDNLDYTRDYENETDPFAIKILKENKFLGYIPRELAQSIAIELDIFESTFEIIVSNIEELKNYNQISAKMRKLADNPYHIIKEINIPL